MPAIGASTTGTGTVSGPRDRGMRRLSGDGGASAKMWSLGWFRDGRRTPSSTSGGRGGGGFETGVERPPQPAVVEEGVVSRRAWNALLNQRWSRRRVGHNLLAGTPSST